MPSFPFSLWSCEDAPQLTVHTNSTQSFSSTGVPGPHPAPVLPSLLKSGQLSPESLFRGTLSRVQLPTAKAAKGHDGKPRRGDRWQGGQQNCK